MDQYLEFAANHTLLVTGLFLSFFLLVFTELARKSRSVSQLEPPDAVGLINADAVVVDLRNPEAYQRGHIVNARNIPLDALDDALSKLSELADKPLVAVCDAGNSSARVVDRLRKAGHERVYGLRGGMNAWQEASLPVVSGRKPGKKKK